MGELEVTDPAPRQPASRIEWGGSGADLAGAPPRSTSTSPIYNIAGLKLRAAPGAKVRLLGVSTVLYMAPGGMPCNLPAVMRAPRGLVVRHPAGRWFLTAHEGERIRLIGLRHGL